MLRNVRSFYARSNAYEVLFTLLTVSIASFFIVFGIMELIGLRSTSVVKFVLMPLLIGFMIPAPALIKRAFSIPRASKALLLASLSVSLVILHMML